MSRSYKGVRVKAHHVYSIEDLMALYGVTANTISNWNADGLLRSDGQKPYLIKAPLSRISMRKGWHASVWIYAPASSSA